MNTVALVPQALPQADPRGAAYQAVGPDMATGDQDSQPHPISDLLARLEGSHCDSAL